MSNDQAYELLYFDPRTGRQVKENQRDTQWASWTCTLGELLRVGWIMRRRMTNESGLRDQSENGLQNISFKPWLIHEISLSHKYSSICPISWYLLKSYLFHFLYNAHDDQLFPLYWNLQVLM